ncbi:Sensor protein VraS [compost metagenome]
MINNIIKHADATEVLVQLSYQDNLLALTVEDNGKGFDRAVVSLNGAGLSNMENRIKTLGGTFELNSSNGNGTTVFIEFDLTAEHKYV